MAIYRYSRNIEASIIDGVKAILTANDWSNVTVEKTFSRVYNQEPPTVCIRVGDTTHLPVEIGDTNTRREVQVLIDLFCSGDGQRLDLKDCLIANLKSGFVYYDYVITNGDVDTKTANGRIRVLNILDRPVDFDIDKDELEVQDRYRHLITLTISLGRVES